jgi:DNA-binding NarL/FixJ family response regulator
MPDGGISTEANNVQPHFKAEVPRVLTQLTTPLLNKTVRIGSTSSTAKRQNFGDAASQKHLEVTLRGEELGKPLSHRQTQILEYASKGLSHKDIAEQLGIGVQTVKNQASTILSKMGVSTTIEAIDRAVNSGVINSQELEAQFDLSRLAGLTAAERRSYSLIANASDDEGLKEIAYKSGIALQTLKNDASMIWKKLGISRKQIKQYHQFAVKNKLQNAKDIADAAGEIDVFSDIPLPNEKSEFEARRLSEIELQALTLSIYGLTKPEIAEILGINYSALKSMMNKGICAKLDARGTVDAAVKAMIRGDIAAEAVIPDGFENKIDLLSGVNREIVNAFVDNPSGNYDEIAKALGMQSITKFRVQQILDQLGASSKDHVVILVKALRIAKEKIQPQVNVKAA